MRRAALGICFLVACAELKLPAAHRTPSIAVQVEPLGELERAPAVLRLRLPDERGRSELADFHFFAGTLSSYYLHRLAARDEPDTLLAREIDVLAWSEGDDIVVAPTQALPGGTFSLSFVSTPRCGGSNPLQPNVAPIIKLWWREVDSNHRRHEPADLQSAPVGRLGIPPKNSCL